MRAFKRALALGKRVFPVAGTGGSAAKAVEHLRSKPDADTELLDAIRVVASGDVYVRPSVARLLATQMVLRSEPGADTPRARLALLSNRERTVLQLVAEGYNGPEIGERLRITAKTVDTYKQRIHEKIGLANRPAYVRFAIDVGLLRT